MQVVVVPGTDVSVSRFILGTGSLFTGRSEAATQQFLERAVELGFLHMDTAPVYGFGHAERALAPLLKRHRHVTVTTKVGLYAPGGTRQSAVQVLARKVAGRLVPSLTRAESSFAIARAMASFEDSLGRLGRERADIFLLHEPEFLRVATDDWLSWLETEKRRGRIGAFGLAGTAKRIEPFLAAASPLAALVQMPDSLDRREADLLAKYARPMQITYSYMAGRPAGSALETLVAALRRNTQGAIVVSTRREERLAQYRDAIEKAEARGAVE